MITDSKKWHYLALKSVHAPNGYKRPIRSLPRLLRGKTLNNNGSFYYLNCFYSIRTDNKIKRHERFCHKHD